MENAIKTNVYPYLTPLLVCMHESIIYDCFHDIATICDCKSDVSDCVW